MPFFKRGNMKNQEYVKKESKNGSVILFIHGFLGGPDHFREFLKVVPNDYAIYNILLDGHAKELKDFTGTSMSRWKVQVDCVLKELSENYEDIIIVGHSMGTLFALDASTRYKIRFLYLLAIPLRVQLSFSAVTNSLKVMFNLCGNDERAIAFKESCSVNMPKNPLLYLGCIPRYLELFGEAKRTRREIIGNVKIPCYAFQSKRDELVSRRSEKYIRKNEQIRLTVLEKSGHFLYNKKDMEILLENFVKLL